MYLICFLILKPKTKIFFLFTGINKFYQNNQVCMAFWRTIGRMEETWKSVYQFKCFDKYRINTKCLKTTH